MKSISNALVMFACTFCLAISWTSIGVAQGTALNSAACRLVTEPSGARDDNNGGGDGSTLIGLNTGMVDNFMVYQIDFSGLAGMSTSGATVTVGVMQGFTNANHGQDTDMIAVSSMAATNADYISGSGIISGADTPADDGSISFANRVQFDGSGTTEPWMDASGAPVANLLATLTQAATVAGYNQGAAPPTLEFTIDAATAQGWIDNNAAALVFSTIDDGDDRSRFFLAGGMGAVTVDFAAGDVLVGDVNCDGSIDLLDVTPFVDAILSGVFDPKADINGDGFVDLLDVIPFVDLLSGG